MNVIDYQIIPGGGPHAWDNKLMVNSYKILKKELVPIGKVNYNGFLIACSEPGGRVAPYWGGRRGARFTSDHN